MPHIAARLRTVTDSGHRYVVIEAKDQVDGANKLKALGYDVSSTWFFDHTRAASPKAVRALENGNFLAVK